MKSGRIQDVEQFHNIKKAAYNHRLEEQEKEEIKLEGRSLCLFKSNNPIRLGLAVILKNTYYEFFIIILIIGSSVILAIDDPLSERNIKEQSILYTIDISITSVFIFEAAMKIVTLGFLFNGKNSYLRSLANVLDLIVIIFSSFSFDRNAETHYTEIKILRIFRVLRPLRLISHNEGLRVSINSLYRSVS